MPDISKINAVAIADIEKVDGILAANIEKVNGLVFSTAPAFVGLLDETYGSGAAAAYSTRRLASATTVLLRVRRDTGTGGAEDDDEADVAYDSNNELSLDSAISNASAGVTATTLGQFLNVGTVGGTTYTNPDSLTVTASCFVDEWKDQSGNANHATQTAFGSQPQIHSGTVNTDLITENGKPALDFLLNDNKILIVSGLSFNTNDVGFFVVCTADTGHNSYATAVNLNPGSGQEIAMAYRTEQISYCGTEFGTGASDTSQNLVSLYADNASNDARGYIDGTQLGTTTTSSNAGTNLVIASLRGIGSAYWEGTIQEIVFYASSTKSDHGDIETNINDYFDIYT